MIAALLWVVSGLIMLPLLVFSVETLAGLFDLRDDVAPRIAATAVLIPAHNEAAGIAAMIAKLVEARREPCRIIVVADNCSDQTADLARAAGATVIERNDPSRRGKGYALDFGRSWLRADPPEIVVVLDADCWVTPGSIERLASAAAETGQPVQCVNLLEPKTSASPMVHISNFAMVVKNLVRARGLVRTGGITLLTGTGMAFPWRVFCEARLATGSIVEDLQQALELTRAGYRPRFVTSASVRSHSAHVDDLLEERARWEGGFVRTARTQALPMLWHGITARSRASVALGFHLLVPPLAMLIAAATVGVLILATAAALGASAMPALAAAAALALTSMATIAAWLKEGQRVLPIGSLLMGPVYVLWKIPMYFGLLRHTPRQWVRTRRRPSD